MTRIALTLSKSLTAVTLVTLLAACSGGSNAPASGTQPPAVTPVIQGIATPSSVSVVTATNAS